jgi:hypothetical protein
MRIWIPIINHSSSYLTGNALLLRSREQNQLMLFKETVAVCCENYMGHGHAVA